VSEAIGEMILPGTYIEVRSEGLIGVGGISTGNIGIVGTANKGPVGTFTILGSYSEALDTFGLYDRWATGAGATPLTLTRALEQVFKGGGSTVYAVRIASGTPGTMQWAVNSNGDQVFTLSAASPGTWANGVQVTFANGTLTAQLGRLKETFTGATAADFAAAVNSGSRLLSATTPTDALSGRNVTAVSVVNANAGSDGANVTTVEVAAGLALLATQPINIVTVAGLPASTVGATLLAHLEATENDGYERIGVIGASSDVVNSIVSDDATSISSPRAVLVAPGLLADDAARTEANKQVALPAAYSAALVVGRLSTVAPHVSLTNKDVAADGLSVEYTRADQKQLLTNRVLVLQRNLGFRVLKGITTDTGAFRQISVRRIVDYAKAGVRVGANPYIGRLNNARVRAALKATLDGFLAGMVQDEMLIGYQLDVTATRAEEINGIALVTMTLQPTFSIDFVKVIMTLS
jgi:Phage tail sheath C-terminal domain